VTARVDVAPNDVHEALADAEHAEAKAILGPILCGTILPANVGLRRTLPSRLRRFCNAPAGAMLRKLPKLGFARVDERCREGFESDGGPTSPGLRSLHPLRLGLRRDRLRVWGLAWGRQVHGADGPLACLDEAR
jgi:hypothetical protein